MISNIARHADRIGPTGCWLLAIIADSGGSLITTNQEFAERVGVDNETFAKYRKRLVNAGLLRYERGRVKHPSRFSLEGVV